MGIKAKSGNKGVISNAVNEFQKRVEESAVFAFSALGEDLVKYAKSKHNYTDQTGNLTNSIGYVVLLHGNVRAVGGFVDSGKSPGLDKAMMLAKDIESNVTLIIVAGMNYAAYVEAKGYNVILPAELKAQTDFPIVMKGLIDKAKKRMIHD